MGRQGHASRRWSQCVLLRAGSGKGGTGLAITCPRDTNKTQPKPQALTRNTTQTKPDLSTRLLH